MSVKGPQSNTAELAERFKLAQYSGIAPLSPLPQVGGTGTLNPLRRWPFNLQSALCVEFKPGGAVGTALFAFGGGSSALELFVFAEASPIVVTAEYHIGPYFIGNTQTQLNFPSPSVPAPTYQTTTHGDYDPTPTLVTKGDGSPYAVTDYVGAGAALHAAVLTSGVRVKGFPFIVSRPLPSTVGAWSYVSATLPSVVNTTILNFSQTFITYQSLAASPNGFVPFAGASDGLVTVVPSTPVFLGYNGYTTAIRDNKNLIETPSGNFRVVGLFRSV